MIQIEHARTYAWEAAIRGMRNPMNSWEKSDTIYGTDGYPIIGMADYELMQKLVLSGSDHAKFMRQILVSVDVVAPLYWWKECDTYKVGTTANSCSTMHKITEKEFSADDFSCERMSIPARAELRRTIAFMEKRRREFLATKDQRCWNDIIQTLPSSYNQRRTLTMNYWVLHSMYHARKNHKLQEWRDFCKWIEDMPYAEVLICLQ